MSDDEKILLTVFVLGAVCGWFLRETNPRLVFDDPTAPPEKKRRTRTFPQKPAHA